jgi:cytochrome oxidase assembly protein ShyY1
MRGCDRRSCGWRGARIIAPLAVVVRVSRGGRLAFGWVLALACIALFASLGNWQLRRMHEKQAMLDAAARVLQQRNPQPLSLAADPERARLYDWAVGRGRFVGPPLLLDNQVREGRVGVRVYRVLRPEPAAGEKHASDLLVDLGWLPVAGDRRLPDVASASDDIVEIRGLLTPPPSSGLAVGAGMLQRDRAWLLMRVDTDEIGRRLALPAPLAARVLRLDPALPIGHARDLDILPNTLPPERHLGYAVQWFGLALTVLVTALVLTLRKPRP